MSNSIQSRIPNLCKHRGTGQFYATLNGREFYFGRMKAAAESEYNRLIAEWLANDRRLPGPSRTVAELILAYWTHVERHYRRPDGTPTSEVEEYRRTLRVLRQLYGQTPAGEFGPLALKAVRQKMIEQGWCRGVVNQRVGRVRRMFRWATENELVPASVHHGLLAVRGLERGRSEARETEPVKPVPVAIVEETLPQLNRTAAAMVRVQLLTGMRPGELVVMRAADIDMSGPVWLFRPESHKTAHHGHERIIAIGPQAQEVIRPFLVLKIQSYLFSPQQADAELRADKRMKRKSPVQPSQRNRHKRKPRKQPGERYTTSSYAHAIRAACARAWPLPEHLAKREDETKVEWKARLSPEQREEIREWRRSHSWHPHQLRHTRATELRKQFGLDAARTVLGHRSPQITETYAALDMGKAVEIALKVG